MNHNLSISASVAVNATTSQIWKALTDPEKIKLWLFGTETIADWKPGSPVIFQGEFNGVSCVDKGVVVDNQQEKLLSYKYWSGFSGLEDIPEYYSLVSFALEARDDHHFLTVTQNGFANEEALAHSNASWQSILNILKDVAEKNL